MRKARTELRRLRRPIIWFAVDIFIVAICASFSLLKVSAQSTTQEKPVLKQFGSSLDRLKWDPVKQAAVETAPGKTPAAADEGDVIRIETELVVCDVLVVDKDGRPVQGLTKSDFVVAEDGQPQQVSHFSLGSDTESERAIVLVFDYSSSQLPYIRNTAEAAKTLVDNLGPRDRMAIVTDDVELKVDFTRDKFKLKDALEDLKQRATLQDRFGLSDQFSALMATVRELFSKEDSRRVVIFQTDGDELYLLQPADLFRFALVPPPAPDASEREKRRARARLEEALSVMNPKRSVKEFGLNDIINAAEKSRATIYSIIPGRQYIGRPTEELLQNVRNQIDDDVVTPRGKESKRYPQKTLLNILDEWGKYQLAVSSVATKTGGFTSFLENPDQAQGIYSRILSDMNSRYVIGYYPTNKTHDGKRRKVSLEVRNHPEYQIEGRKSYFAPEPQP